MPDLSQAIAVLRSMRAPMFPGASASGAGWGHENPLAAKRVPFVPDVPAQTEARLGSRDAGCPHDALERAAILEFCEGLTRKDADIQARAEFGCTPYEAFVDGEDWAHRGN
jgi:hypothetical protein